MPTPTEAAEERRQPGGGGGGGYSSLHEDTPERRLGGDDSGDGDASPCDALDSASGSDFGRTPSGLSLAALNTTPMRRAGHDESLGPDAESPTRSATDIDLDKPDQILDQVARVLRSPSNTHTLPISRQTSLVDSLAQILLPEDAQDAQDAEPDALPDEGPWGLLLLYIHSLTNFSGSREVATSTLSSRSAYLDLIVSMLRSHLSKTLETNTRETPIPLREPASPPLNRQRTARLSGTVPLATESTVGVVPKEVGIEPRDADECQEFIETESSAEASVKADNDEVDTHSPDPSPSSTPTARTRAIEVQSIPRALRRYTPSLLVPGNEFVGYQKSDRHTYNVHVEIKHVDMDRSFLCGYLRIEGLTADHPTLTTYFEGEVIGDNYGFTTRHPDWGSSDRQDMLHWNRFAAWKPLAKSARQPGFSFKNFTEREHIFMRWKEHFLVPDHKVTDIHGASFEGFYYICFNQRLGVFDGIYYHSKSERFQQLQLKHKGRHTGCEPAIELV